MNKTKRDLAIEAAVDIFKDRIDVDCKHGSGFFKEHVNKDGSVERRPIGSKKGHYWGIHVGKFTILAHRLRWVIEKGEIPEGLILNHKNNNTNDNSIENLELVKRNKNAMNSLIPCNNKSGVPGICRRNNKWRLVIGCDGIKISFGEFTDFNIARIIRDRYFVKYLLNEPIDVKDKENRISFIKSCHNKLILTKIEEEIVKQYSHLIYSTIEEICGESYIFNVLVKKNEYISPVRWRPDPNSVVSYDEQIYLKIIEEFEDRGESGLWRKKKNNYEKIENKPNIDGYILCKVGGVGVFTHRIIWMLSNGLLKRNEIIDHIDGDRSNNKIENLQIATDLINGRKKGKSPKSKYRHIGVRAAQGSKTWNAKINMIGYGLNLGNYKS